MRKVLRSGIVFSVSAWKNSHKMPDENKPIEEANAEEGGEKKVSKKDLSKLERQRKKAEKKLEVCACAVHCRIGFLFFICVC